MSYGEHLHTKYQQEKMIHHQSVVQEARDRGLGTNVNEEQRMLLLQETSDDPRQEIPFQRMMSSLAERRVAFDVVVYRETPQRRESLIRIPLPIVQQIAAL
jgi:hypothetical protein